MAMDANIFEKGYQQFSNMCSLPPSTPLSVNAYYVHGSGLDAGNINLALEKLSFDLWSQKDKEIISMQYDKHIKRSMNRGLWEPKKGAAPWLRKCSWKS